MKYEPEASRFGFLFRTISRFTAAFIILFITIAIGALFISQYWGAMEEVKRLRSKISSINIIPFSLEGNEFTQIADLSDAKQMVDKVEWQLSWVDTIQDPKTGKMVTKKILVDGPYYYKTGVENFSRDSFVVWYAEKYSLDGGQTWQEIPHSQHRLRTVLIFIENSAPIDTMELGKVNRCEPINQEGKQYLPVVFSGVGTVEYYQEIKEHKVFKDRYPKLGGEYWFGWCNKSKKLQVIGFSKSQEFIDEVIRNYFQRGKPH